MSIVNRRNAILGWAVWQAFKSVGKQKVRKAAPGVEDGKPNKSLVAVVLAAAAGATAVVLGRRSSTES